MAPLKHVYLVVRRKGRWCWSQGGPYKINKMRENEAEIFRNRIAIAICMAVVFLVGAKLGLAQLQPDISVARTRAKHLRRGTTLSDWFAQVYDAKGCTEEHFESWNALVDLARIKAMGFDHVHLSVNLKAMWRHNDADEIPAAYLTYLDTAVKMILEEDLAVVIDIHPDGDFKRN